MNGWERMLAEQREEIGMLQQELKETEAIVGLCYRGKLSEQREEIERLRVALQSVVQWLSLGLRHQGNLERYLRGVLGEPAKEIEESPAIPPLTNPVELPASSDDPRDEIK